MPVAIDTVVGQLDRPTQDLLVDQVRSVAARSPFVRPVTIVNWYAADAALGWHADRSEARLDLPIVTISLGDPATWAVREGPESPSSSTTLVSGAVTLLAGRTRSWEHTISRIHPRPSPTEQGLLFETPPAPLLEVPGRISMGAGSTARTSRCDDPR